MSARTLKALSGFMMAAVIAFAVSLAFPANAFAMHIAEGFLPPGWCVAWGLLSAPFVIIGFNSVRKRLAASPKSVILLALCGAFVFLLSALKLPSVSGSSSHPTGVGLCAILFGPAAATVISVIVLIFQALLLAHGGLTTLGANVFSMGIAGPMISFAIFRLVRMTGGTSVAVFLAAALGDLSTYIVTSFQMGVAHPMSGSVTGAVTVYLSIFAITQIPLAVCDGLLTVIIFDVIKKYRNDELAELLTFKNKTGGREHA